MKRKLYIHTGPPKTGTSALQYVLRDHDGSVIHYPKAGQWNDGAHHNLVLNFFGDYAQPKTVREDIGVLFDRVSEDASHSQVPIVISSEMLAVRPSPGHFIDALLSRLGGDLDVEILFTVREHFERTASLYGQRVRSRYIREKLSPDEYLPRRLPTLCYASKLLRLVRTNIPIHLFSYEPGHDLVPRILRYIGFPDERIAVPPTRNPSRAIKLILAVLVANRTEPNVAQRRKIVKALEQLQQRTASAQFIFGDEAALVAERRFARDRAFMNKRFKFELATPDLNTMTNAFWIDEVEFDEISDALAGLGDTGKKLRAGLRAFVRAPAA